MRVWTALEEAHLKEFYNDQVKISPAILAYKVHKTLRETINRLSKLGLRNRMEKDKW